MKYLPIAFLFFAFLACKNDAPHIKADPETAGEGPSAYTKLPEENIPSKEGAKRMFVKEAKLTWRCSKFTGSEHTGTVDLKEGYLLVKEGFVLDGELVFDMKTIKNTDLQDASMAAELENHLKSEEFFDVAKFPTATFKITNTLPSVNVPDINRVIFGELTIKDKTHDINVPMSLSVAEERVKAISSLFAINRTRWGLDYGSAALGTLKDNIIVDEIRLNVEILAAE